MAKNTIAINAAAKKLDVPVEKLREVLKPFYPETWESIKSIKLVEFETIAQALQEIASQPEEVEPRITIETGEPPVVHDSPELQDVTDYSPVSEISREHNEPEDPDINPVNSSDSIEQDLDPNDEGPCELAPQQAQALKIAVQRTFSDFAIDINNIVSALAYASAMKAFSDFKTIHSATFRHHAEQYINDFDSEYQEMLADLDAKCNPTDFLKQRGITTA